MDAPQPPALTRRQVNLVFGTIQLGMLLAAPDQTIVSTALPTIVGDLGGGNHVSWVVASYLITDTIAVVLAGKFGDLLRERGKYQGALGAVFGVTTVIGPAAGRSVHRPPVVALVLPGQRPPGHPGDRRRRVHPHRAPCAGADAPAAAVRQQGLLGGLRGQLRGRVRDARRDDVPADVPAARPGGLGSTRPPGPGA